jgi:hypothetical protein
LLVDLEGSMRRIELPGDLSGPQAPASPAALHWSPDGSRLAIEAARDAPEVSIDTFIVPVDGSTTVVLHDARRAVWSRDGQGIAVVGATGPSGLPEGTPISPRTIDVANAGGSNRRVIAVPQGDLDGFWFVWGVPRVAVAINRIRPTPLQTRRRAVVFASRVLRAMIESVAVAVEVCSRSGPFHQWLEIWNEPGGRCVGRSSSSLAPL